MPIDTSNTPKQRVDWRARLTEEEAEMLSAAYDDAKGEAMNNASDDTWPRAAPLYDAQHKYHDLENNLKQKYLS